MAAGDDRQEGIVPHKTASRWIRTMIDRNAVLHTEAVRIEVVRSL